ncbi:hypothetical protein J4437_07915 [Candidatus Woesearchaeota archaeon]|nr:hypothetical protein [Candidatus Woesearchaeota archaeon]
MKLTLVQQLMLFSLGQYYEMLNQPLVETPLRLQTSKITFIELLLKAKILSKHERAIYKNLEDLEKKKLIAYENRMIRLTDLGLKELQRIRKEISQFNEIAIQFQRMEKPKRKLQTTLG